MNEQLETLHKTAILMAEDILSMQKEFKNNQFDYACDILFGGKHSWKQYQSMSDEQINNTYQQSMQNETINEDTIKLANLILKNFFKK